MQLTENEIRGLCLKSREIFLSQPILLELEAPLKICGKFSRGTRRVTYVIGWHSRLLGAKVRGRSRVIEPGSLLDLPYIHRAQCGATK